VTIEKQGAAEPIEKNRQLCLDCFVIGTVGLGESFLELLGADRPSPEITMLLRPGRNDPEPASSPGANPASPRPVDDRGVDFVFGTIAVDGGSGGPCDDCATPTLECSPDQSIDERILEGDETCLASGCERDQPVGIIATRMGNRKQDRKVPSCLMNQWWMELAHGAKG
jgi:hypothetical protein